MPFSALIYCHTYLKDHVIDLIALFYVPSPPLECQPHKNSLPPPPLFLTCSLL